MFTRFHLIMPVPGKIRKFWAMCTFLSCCNHYTQYNSVMFAKPVKNKIDFFARLRKYMFLQNSRVNAKTLKFHSFKIPTSEGGSFTGFPYTGLFMVPFKFSRQLLFRIISCTIRVSRWYLQCFTFSCLFSQSLEKFTAEHKKI